MRKLALVALVAVLCAACEGGGSNNTTGPSGSAYNQTQTGSVSVYGTTRHAVNITRGGNLTVRLSWPDSSVDLDLYLAPSTCVDLYPIASCGVLVSSSTASGTAEQVARSVSSGDAYFLFVDNMSTTQAQNYTLNITID